MRLDAEERREERGRERAVEVKRKRERVVDVAF
jgi:hypothetical protein